MVHYSEGAEIAVDLVNSFDVFADEELLGSVDDLIDFAVAHGVEAGAPTADDLERLRRARSALRGAMLAAEELEAVAALNELMGTTGPRPRLEAGPEGRWRFRYDNPEASLSDRVLAEATAQVLHEIRDHGMRRFSTCASSTCEDVFVDHSRNHSRRYCTPEVCGNREAQRAYRARQAERRAE